MSPAQLPTMRYYETRDTGTNKSSKSLLVNLITPLVNFKRVVDEVQKENSPQYHSIESSLIFKNLYIFTIFHKVNLNHLLFFKKIVKLH